MKNCGAHLVCYSRSRILCCFCGFKRRRQGCFRTGYEWHLGLIVPATNLMRLCHLLLNHKNQLIRLGSYFIRYLFESFDITSVEPAAALYKNLAKLLINLIQGLQVSFHFKICSFLWGPLQFGWLETKERLDSCWTLYLTLPHSTIVLLT